MTYDPNNPFAKILRGELPAHRVYEDDRTFAFMDLMPQAEGHTLVIPKAAAMNLFDLEASELAATIQTTRLVAAAVKKAFSAEGVMIAQLNGAAAGQSVFHLHFHILPRNDGVDLRMHVRNMADPKVLSEHAQRIRSCLPT
ncbi:MAG: HIT family protein [Proteobacteria bacterium]|nr:HIT family protein [Pseudomonadota bacterium]